MASCGLPTAATAHALEIELEKIGTAVIGGGAVGCAILYELAKAGVKDLFLFEKLPRVGEAQSGRNSGVVHAGIYYATGSLKAEICVEANPLMYEFCRKNDVPVANVGKLVVATSPDEIERLHKLFEQAKANSVPGVRMLTREQSREFEPNVDVSSSMHVPTNGIVDAATYTKTLARLAQVEGAEVLTGFEVTRVEPTGGVFELTGRHNGTEEVFRAQVMVNAAGLYSDVIAKMVNPRMDVEMAPLRGEYCKFNRKRRRDIWLNGLNVYPTPETVTLDGIETGVVGVHLTPTFALTRDGDAVVGDTVTVGPEFAFVPDREDYETGRRDAGFFLGRAKRFFPGLRIHDLEVDFTGIMANLRDQNDFIIMRDRRHANCVQLVGIDSPGLTCSLAIARRVRRMLV